MKPSGGQGNIPEGWRLVRLGDVAEVAFSGVDKRTIGGEFPIKLCNYTDVFYNRRIQASMDFMPATATQSELNRWALKQGDVLFTKDSETADEIGIPAFVADDLTDVLCGYHLGLARPSQATVNGSFLARILASRESAQEFGRIANGITRFGLTLDATRNLPVLLPPLAEQRAIANVLDSIDDAIERTEAVIAATEQLRDSLLHQLLTRGVRGWHTGWKEAPGLGMIPASWEVVRLGDVVTVASGQSDPKAAKFQGSLFVAPDDIESGTGRLINRRTVAEAHAISGKYRFDKFEVLYSKIRPYLMKVYRPHESGLCSADIYPLRPKSMFEAAYLALALLSLSFTDYTRTCSDRTGIPKINRIDLFKYRLTLPSLPEQRTIAAMLDGVAGAIARAREERDRFRSLKEATADALLTGRVRVGGG